MNEPRLLRYGDQAVLVEVADARAVSALYTALVAYAYPAIRALVPASRTVLIEYDPGSTSGEEIARLVARCSSAPTTARESPTPTTEAPMPGSRIQFAGVAFSTAPPQACVRIPVHYDGLDLADVARTIGESVDSVINRHVAGEYVVQFCGFSPGFAYLIGLDPVLQLPRLASPRAEVPAGSVAIAGEFSGIYPKSSPGGWRLLGRTEAVVFDIDRSPPALLPPGTRVRFVRS